MANLDYKQFSRRRRPHIHSPGSVLFVTYRLTGSVPKSTVREYKVRKQWLENESRRALRAEQSGGATELKKWVERVEQFNREWFLKFEEILHRANVGPMWMQDERVAKTVAESLQRLDTKSYRLDAYSVMSNHVHTIFKPFVSETNLREIKDDNGHPLFMSEYPGLSKIMHSVKGRSARECNLILARFGDFWEHESFDHVIRPGKFNAAVKYVLNNPVKAGLVRHCQEWPWNYCRQKLSDKL